ncbi:hypothetical protein G5B38_12780 [Pseudohalocynthiibacter aestuariivivens]|nr:hypothetical protein [Pseudohalocynthiibacter aestuariivivens]QIE46329.1 hypothetical protein G5B38_12780 [Pseudohalocynthiibacter aestuariivivens]
MTRLICLICALFIANPATATPPRLTQSEDRVMAATQTHIYVLRDIVDNLGSHFAGLHDQHLIEVALDTGEATLYWPLRRMTVNHLPENDLLVPGVVTERAGVTHAMMDILREIGAEPIWGNIWEDVPLSLHNGALMRGDVQLATPFGLRKAARAQLAILRDAYPPNETETGFPALDRIDFYDLYAPGDWECRLLRDRYAIHRATDRVTVAKLRCEDTELTGFWSFHFLIYDDL